MGDSMAEVVQLRRAEEQANPDPEDRASTARLRWEFRTAERTVDRSKPGGQGMGMIGVRLPVKVIEILTKHGMPGVVARGIIMRWATRAGKAKAAP